MLDGCKNEHDYEDEYAHTYIHNISSRLLLQAKQKAQRTLSTVKADWMSPGYAPLHMT